MTDLRIFREYEPFECGEDGYPYVWHRNATGVLDDVIEYMAHAGATHIDFASGVKHLVRAEAGHRCVRCFHPFVVGESSVWCDGESDIAPGSRFGAASDAALFEGLEGEIDGFPEGHRAVGIARHKTLWSPCDARCAHSGPMRVWTRLPSGSEGWSPFDPTPEACGPAVEAVAPTPVQAAWRILTVHHLNGRKHDLRWWNLAALCQRCHLLIQRKVIMERIFPFEHTEWFKPHAAAWYAYIYSGENLTREQAIERQDELLALERMA